MESFETFLASMASMELAKQMEQAIKAAWRINEKMATLGGGGQPPGDPKDDELLLVNVLGQPSPYPLPSKNSGRRKPQWKGPDGREWNYLNKVAAAMAGAPGEGWMPVALPGEGGFSPGGGGGGETPL